MLDPIRLLLVDDDERTRDLIQQVLAEVEDISVVAEAADGLAATVAVRELKPDLVLMDTQMPHMDGIRATRHIKTEWPWIGVIAFAGNQRDAGESREAGADACVLKEAEPSILVEAIRALARHR